MSSARPSLHCGRFNPDPTWHPERPTRQPGEVDVGRDWDYLPPPYIHPAGDPYTAFADCIGAGLATLTGATLPA